MISVADALSEIFELLAPMPVETVSLTDAVGRVLAEPAVAARDQPPFASSAMDGYALAGAKPGATYRVIGESQAGKRFRGTVGPGEAVRIFTGAPVPEGADRVVIQEDVERRENRITLNENLDEAHYVRPAGGDFRTGSTVEAPRRLGPGDIALLAAMNVSQVKVFARPEVAVISTGDELVQPGEEPGPDQIISSNALGLKALLQPVGAQVRLLPLARDTVASLNSVLDRARGADLIVTIGGASVGDHDLVAKVLRQRGARMAFHKVAMRPGKPLMAGRIGASALVGLPGNPVSALVCGTVFLRPALDVLLGLPGRPARRETARLAAYMGANGPREHYLRARRLEGGRVEVFGRQDSSLLSVLAAADCLVVREPGAPALPEGAEVEFVPL